MKKILFVLAIATMLFAGCSKDDEPSETTYTFRCELDTYGMGMDCIIFEYNAESEKIANNSFECDEGFSKTFTANEKAEKVKIYLELGSSSRWVQQVFYLEKGGNTEIVIDGQTKIGNKEP